MTKRTVNTTVSYYSNAEQTAIKQVGCTMAHKNRMHRLLTYQDGGYRADYKAVVQAILHDAPPRQKQKQFADFMDSPENTAHGGRVFVERAFMQIRRGQQEQADAERERTTHSPADLHCIYPPPTSMGDVFGVLGLLLILFSGGFLVGWFCG